jgi:hypothetical protein
MTISVEVQVLAILITWNSQDVRGTVGLILIDDMATAPKRPGLFEVKEL